MLSPSGQELMGLACGRARRPGACPCDPSSSLPPRPLSTAGTLAQPFASSEPRDAASHPQTRAPPVPRRAMEPSTPRSQAQRRPSGRTSPLRQRAPSLRAERALVAEMGEWVRLGRPEPGSGRTAWTEKSNQQKTCITL